MTNTIGGGSNSTPTIAGSYSNKVSQKMLAKKQ